MEPDAQLLFGAAALLAGVRLNFWAAGRLFWSPESPLWLHGLDVACGGLVVALGVSLVSGAVGRLW